MEIDNLEADNVADSAEVSRKRPYGTAGRCIKQASKRTYAKKRKNIGKKKDDSSTKKSKPVSLKKVKRVKKVSNSHIQGYRLLDLSILQDIFICLNCPNCQETGTMFLEEDHQRKKGLASYLVLTCECGYEKEFYTSRTVDNCNNINTTSKKGMKPFEINIRAVYGMRTIGADHASLEKFCGFINMPKPMTARNFIKISNNLRDAAKVVAQRSMMTAVNELRIKSNLNETDIIDTGVSVDGTWQRRGFSSLNGVVAVISIDSGKLVDIEPMSRYCRECAVHTRLLQDDPDALVNWKIDHKDVCKLVHEGSAPSMEPEGAKRIFGRSIETRNARYTGFYGDGDSKAYTEVKDVYGEGSVTKFECIGHYQKRVGTRIRKLKKRVTGLKINDATIDKLQNYFGIALRSNVSTVKAMSDAILASFFHVASSEGKNYHSYCEKSSTSWCQYQRDIVNGTNIYKDGPGLPSNVILHVKPIYEDLTKPQELKKCLHGKTQNQNESYNGLIWARAPKYRYCAFDKLELAVYDAVANFNDGRQASLDIFKELNIVPGYFTTFACISMNIKRKRSAVHHSLPTWKKARKVIRAEKKRKGDKNKSKEGKTYKTGGF
jgi:hypothetical protein